MGSSVASKLYTSFCRQTWLPVVITSTPAARSLSASLEVIPAPLAAFLLKDLAYLRREPGLAGRLVGNLLNSLLLILFVAFSPIGPKNFAGPYYFFLALSSLAAGRMIVYNKEG